MGARERQIDFTTLCSDYAEPYQRCRRSTWIVKSSWGTNSQKILIFIPGCCDGVQKVQILIAFQAVLTGFKRACTLVIIVIKRLVTWWRSCYVILWFFVLETEYKAQRPLQHLFVYLRIIYLQIIKKTNNRSNWKYNEFPDNKGVLHGIPTA